MSSETCDATLSRCKCSLAVHPSDEPHHCMEPTGVNGEDGGECGGQWLDHPTDRLKVIIVRYPVAAANAAGIAQPIQPITEDHPDRMSPFRFPRGSIRFYPPPTATVTTTATAVAGELTT